MTAPFRSMAIVASVAAVVLAAPAAPAAVDAPGTAEPTGAGDEPLLTDAEQAWLDEHPTIVLSAYANYPPAEFLDGDGRQAGLVADYVALIEQRLGIRFQTRAFRSWDDLLAAARAREVDVVSLAAETRDRTNYLVFTEPYLNLRAVMIANERVATGMELADLRGHTILCASGYAVEEYLRDQAAIHGFTVRPVGNTLAGLRAAAFDSQVIFVSDIAVASHFIELDGITNLHVVGSTDYIYRMGFGVRGDWPELRRILDKALRTITPEQRTAIHERWIHLDQTSGGRSMQMLLPFAIGAGVVLLLVGGVLAWNRSLKRQVDQRTREVERELAERRRAEAELARNQDRLEEIVAQRTAALRRAIEDAENAEVMLAKYAGELEHRNEALTEARTQALQASRIKSEFLANMSHEIRSPMTAILGYAEILHHEGDREQAPPHRLEAIDTIRRNGQHLLDVINDILDLSKLEAGRMNVEVMSCSPVRVALDVVELMQVRADAKDLELGVDFDGPVPGRIRTDPTRLRQILVNLVGNAIKFTDEGSVRMVLRLEDDLLAIDVVDTGIGIDPEQAEHLFRPFTQADTSTTRRFGGTGLGLTISRRFAELLGGTIAVTGRPGAGCTFTVRIDPGPLEDVELEDDPRSAIEAHRAAERARPVTAAELDGALAGLRVLVGEDTPDNQRLIRFHLEMGGASAVIVGTGREIVARALEAERRDEPFDVLLMDMQMPEIDGYEAATLLREGGYRRPIVALTAHAMSGDRERCLAAGMDEYVSKPIDAAELFAAIRAVCHADERPAAAVAAHDGPAGPSPGADWAHDGAAGHADAGEGEGIAVVDLDALMARLHHSEPLLAELVDLFIPECDRLRSRLEAAVEGGKLEGVERLAHSIKGSISNFSAPAATAAALRLEQVARRGGGEEVRAAHEALGRELDRLVPTLERLREGIEAR